MTIPEKLSKWVFDWLAKHRLPTDFQANLLLGDGSTRSFYRIQQTNRSFILVSDPQWTQTQDYPAHQNFLKTHQLPVPEFFSSDPKAGFLLMSDLGDELLQHRILKSPKQKMPWLENAVQLLAKLHGKTYPVPPSLPVATRSFDQEKYLAELRFTLDHLHAGLLGQPPLGAAGQGCLSDFCAEIACIEPQVFCHRDYHCRNLLLLNESLVMIDFQDARMGPPQYDLASLIYDAYVPIAVQERDSLVALYLSTLSPFPLSQKLAMKNFSRDLRRVAFQRVVKAAGSFASFYTRFGKDTHLPYVVPALEYALDLQNSGHGVPENVLPIENWIAQAKAIKIK